MSPKAGKCHIRLIKESDYARIEEIYLAHEGKLLPAGYFELFQDEIRCDSTIYFVAEVDGKVIGGGGISDYCPGLNAFLIYGLVSNDERLKGYGTSIMLARLLFIDPGLDGCQVSLQATEWSADFFSRLGFKWNSVEEDEEGNRFAWGSNTVYPSDRKVFQRILDAGEVTLAADVVGWEQ